MLHPVPHEYGQAPPIVELRGVTAGYEGRHVLTDVTMSIMPGDFVGLLGPSGSGKSTLLRCILGTIDLYSGDVVVEGQSVVQKRPRAGYVPQLETIDWSFPVTVLEVVMMGCTMDYPLFPWHRRRERERAHRIMDRLGISRLANRHIRELSGGEQQRTFLARALVSNPRLLLLDEPTTGVDIKTRDDVMHLLDELNHEGITVVMSTHEINSVAAHLPRVVCLNGRLTADGPPSDVFTSEILSHTYGAHMPVTQYQGVTLVAESPHFFGRDNRAPAHTEPAGHGG